MRYTSDRAERLASDRNHRAQRGAGKLREPNRTRWVLAGFTTLLGLGRGLGNAARRGMGFGLTASLLSKAETEWLCDTQRWSQAQGELPADEQDTVMPDYLLDKRAELDCLADRFGL